MFTGIITNIGTIKMREQRQDTRFVIESDFPAQSIVLGASIACSGCCLTVTDKGESPEGRSWFAVDASAETLSLTTAQDWQAGTQLNLERSLKVGDELGGHIVTGHVDGLARVVSIAAEGGSHRVELDVRKDLARFVAAKGSAAIDGVSLTVNQVEKNRFGVNVIPHTWSVTTLGNLSEGDSVNLEIDILARYVARLEEATREQGDG